MEFLSALDTLSLGQRVRYLRRRWGMSQAELAGTELSDSYVSLIETGKRVPTREVIQLLADRLGVHPRLLEIGGPAQQRIYDNLRRQEASHRHALEALELLFHRCEKNDLIICATRLYVSDSGKERLTITVEKDRLPPTAWIDAPSCSTPVKDVADMR
ncbi:helix-turn-helix transcriptional regulator (plasmid) [Streptosporangium sp. NBC_01495]